MGFFGFGSVHPENWRNYIYGRRPAIYLLLAIIIALLIYALSQVPVKRTVYQTVPRESAWQACMMGAEQELGLPVAEAPAYHPAYVTPLSANRYQVDVSDANKGVAYRCLVDFTPEGNWQVRSLQVR